MPPSPSRPARGAFRRAILVALALTVLAPAPANAAPPPDYLGANAQAMVKLLVVAPERWDAFATRMASDGLRLVRVDAAWSWAEPRPPINGVHTYTWNPADRQNQSLDRVVRTFALRGVRLVPAITTTPAWARATGTSLAAAYYDDFAAFAGAFAARYGRNGSFWAENPTVPFTPIQEYQVWTEANSTHSWTRAPNPPEYVKLLREMAPAIRGADAHAVVLTSIGWQNFEAYVNELYDAGVKGLIDGMGFQPYAPHAPAIVDLVRRMRIVLRNRGDANLPLYITELGQPAVAAGGASSAGSGTVSDAARAATHSLTAEALARSDCDVRDYLIYDLVGSENPQVQGFEAFMGVYRFADAVPNATGRALAAVAARWRAAPASGLVLCGDGTTASTSLLPLAASVTRVGPGCADAKVTYDGNPLEGAMLRIATDRVLASDESNAFGDAGACAPNAASVGTFRAYVDIPNLARSATYQCASSECSLEIPAPPPLPEPGPPSPPPNDEPPAVAAQASSLAVDGTLTTPAKRITATTKQVLYYLKLRTGAQAERFSVRMTPPKFALRGIFDEGESLDGPRAIALQGPGTVGEQRQEPRVLDSCSSRDERFHGYATGATTVDVALPANAQTTLAVRYATGRRAPWVDGDYRMRFDVQRDLVGTYDASSVFAGGPTGAAATTVRTAGPTPGGRTGAHLLLSTKPAGAKGGATPRRIGSRTRIVVSGRLLPARRNRSVVIEWSRPGGRLRTLAKVRTDRNGNFRARAWRPPAKGTYEVWARYPTQSGGLAADRTSCPLVFRRA